MPDSGAGWDRPAVRALLVAAAALAGYVLFWALKWLIGLAVLGTPGGQGLVGGGDFGRWIAGGGDPYVPLAATLWLVATIARSPAALAVMPGLAALVAWSCRHAEVRHRLVAALPAAVVAVLALEAAAGHTLAHAAFVARAVPVGLGAFAALALAVPAASRPVRRSGAAPGRRPAVQAVRGSR